MELGSYNNLAQQRKYSMFFLFQNHSTLTYSLLPPFWIFLFRGHFVSVILSISYTTTNFNPCWFGECTECTLYRMLRGKLLPSSGTIGLTRSCFHKLLRKRTKILWSSFCKRNTWCQNLFVLLWKYQPHRKVKSI